MTAVEAGLSLTAGLLEGQREDPVMGADRLEVVFGTGQVGSALAAHVASLGIAVRTVSRHRPAELARSTDWRAADVTDPEAAAVPQSRE